MTLDSPKSLPGLLALPRSLSSIVVSVGGLAIFLVFASLLLVSFPNIHGYFYGVVTSNKLVSADYPTIENRVDSNVDVLNRNATSGSSLEAPATSSSGVNESVNVSDKYSSPSKPNLPVTSSDASQKEGVKEKGGSVIEGKEGKGLDENSAVASSAVSNATTIGSDDNGCDLYRGSWFFDPLGPLYTNNTCPVVTQMQNCQGNGRPDSEYENWRWKPAECELPRFDAKKFLELMRGKTLAFIGDSVARNQMESMLCLLWQVEVPKNRGNKRMQRYYFRSTNTMIVRIWSSWLVHKTADPVEIAPQSVVKLHLDAPDEDFMQYITGFDVVVLSSGHWFAKQSVYMLNNEVVGGQLWWPDKSRPMKVHNVEAFAISTETILTSLVTHPNYTGLTILRTYSPDHYEGGAWNTGGSCTGKVKPLGQGKLVENGFTDTMHKQQVGAFSRAIKKATNKSKLKLMDITEPFGYRHDGHPGPYRSPDPKKQTKRGPDGRPPPQDCLHWCMPGPVDTWNEFVLELIRREFEGKKESSE
ncbi:protein YLS7 [Euphorbia lathyris]|uniref:protein YLS7 n=1 Tax=Euphorbia lathyris TaxID=212925 RepID=UPI0033143E47